METYLPYEDFGQCAEVLHPTEAFNSIYTGVMFLNVIHQVEGFVLEQWSRHPGVEMWRGHEVILFKYMDTLFEKVFNTPRDTWSPTLVALREAVDQHLDWATSGDFSMDKPKWLGMEQLHLAHRAELIRHQPAVYGVMFPNVDASLPMIWPVIKD